MSTGAAAGLLPAAANRPAACLPRRACLASPQRISLAKTKSDAVAKLDGTFRERPKAERRKKETEGAGHLLLPMHSASCCRSVVQQLPAPVRVRRLCAATLLCAATPHAGDSALHVSPCALACPAEAPAQKKAAPAAAAPAAAAPAAAPAAAAPAGGPNHILFVENLPDSATDMMVGMLFQQFTGFKEVGALGLAAVGGRLMWAVGAFYCAPGKQDCGISFNPEASGITALHSMPPRRPPTHSPLHALPATPTQVRMVPNRPGIAFVEYDDAGQAGVAMQGLQGFKLATDK